MLTFARRYWLGALMTGVALLLGSASANDLKPALKPAVFAGMPLPFPIPQNAPGGAHGLNPAAINIWMPADLKWTENKGNGIWTAVLFGDPAKEGLYITLARWPAHKMSRPHYHPHDRYATVISGTWWVGTGPKFDPDKTVPVPAGGYVLHHGKEIHYDGAKDGDVILEILGMGPATAIDAEVK